MCTEITTFLLAVGKQLHPVDSTVSVNVMQQLWQSQHDLCQQENARCTVQTVSVSVSQLYQLHKRSVCVSFSCVCVASVL